MPINTLHPDFDALQSDFRTMRDVVAGEGAVKKAGDLYLPKLGGQSEAEYAAYKARALFYGATARTLEALVGAICRKAPILHGPETFVAKYGADITGTGVNLATFAGDVIREFLTTSMEGILVDHDGTRPFLSPYSAENVTNILPDGTVVLRESEMVPDPKDKYTLTCRTNYREIFTDGNNIKVRVWKPVAKKTGGMADTYKPAGTDTELVFRGKPLESVPFVLARINALPLLPLAQANLSHYLTSADLENGLHWGGIFTPWIASSLDPKDPLLAAGFKVGGSAAWMLPQNSQVGMLEVTGAALTALEARLQGKQDLMAALGVRLLIPPKKVAETEATTRINAGNEGSTLSRTVDAIESAITKALQILAAWDGIADTSDVRIEINRDFIDASLTPEEITAYLAVYQAGGMTLDTFLNLLLVGEILPTNRTVQQEKDALEMEGPRKMSLPKGAGL